MNAQQDQENGKANKEARFYLDLLTHDIKNLNQGVFGYLELMEMLPDTTLVQRKFLEEALSYIRMSNNLIRSIESEDEAKRSNDLQGLMKVVTEAHQCISSINKDVRIELDQTQMGKGLKVKGSPLIVDMFIYVFDFMVKRTRANVLKVQASSFRSDDGTVQIALRGDFTPLEGTEWDALFSLIPDPKNMKKGRLMFCRRVAERFGGNIWYEPPVQGSPYGGGAITIALKEGAP